MASVDLAALDEQRLAEWLLARRWFGSKARDVAQIHVLDAGLGPALVRRAHAEEELVDVVRPGREARLEERE